MMKKIKNFLRTHTKYGHRRYLDFLFRYDADLYLQHSCMNLGNIENIATRMRILSHTIEKGMSLSNCKMEFGREKILELIQLCELYENSSQKQDYQAVELAKNTIAAYNEFQKSRGVDVSFIPTAFVNRISNTVKAGTMFIASKQATNFRDIAFNRHSSRSYADVEVPDEIIRSVVEIAQTSPSACNRQATRIYACKNKEKIQKIMNLHGGIRTFEIPSVIFVITGNLNLYQDEYERNTVFVDGGIFVMNLLYSLDSFGLVACPVIWGNEPTNDKILSELLDIPENEKIVSLVTAGICPSNGYKAAQSPKRKIEDVLHII